MSSLLASRRARLVAILVVATAAISVLVVAAAGDSLSYYVTPEEFAQEREVEGKRWRIGGRVIEESIVERDGRPIEFTIRGYDGATVSISYDGAYPSLFGPNAIVIAEGTAMSPTHLDASLVIIKHEDAFVTDAADSPVSAPVPR